MTDSEIDALKIGDILKEHIVRENQYIVYVITDIKTHVSIAGSIYPGTTVSGIIIYTHLEKQIVDIGVKWDSTTKHLKECTVVL